MTTQTGLALGRGGPSARGDVLWVSILWSGLLVWVAAVAVSPTRLTVVHRDLGELARNLASGTTLVAGVVCLAIWRLTADPAAARRSIALLVLGASYPAAAAIGPLLGASDGLDQAAPSTRALFVVPILALVLPGANWRRQSRAHPIPLPYLVAVGWAMGLVLGLALFARHSLQADGLALASRLICCLTMLAWLVLAVRSAPRSAAVAFGAQTFGGQTFGGQTFGAQRRGGGGSLATAFALLAVAEGFRLFAVEGQAAVLGIAPGIQLAASFVFLTAVCDDLRAARRGEEESSAELVRAVAGLEARLVAVEQAERERLHDARSAMLGVIGASELLGAASPSIDEGRLRGLIAAELHRLQGVLDGRETEPVTDFDLAAALGPVVLAHQLDGCLVHADLTDEMDDALASAVAVGRAGTTATVLDNLLRNARVHAPNAAVRVSVHAWGDTVSVVVEDDGPGIPADERARVLRAGVRGSGARGRGEGLGLHNCLSAMQGQGGSLRLDAGERGGTRVTLTLPRVTTTVRALPRGA